MPKKLAFQQIERDSCTIQFYERTAASCADIVNCASDQFFAGACFALNKHSGVCRRDAFHFLKHHFQSSTLTYDLLESALIRVLVIGPESFESFHEDLLAPQDLGSLTA